MPRFQFSENLCVEVFRQKSRVFPVLKPVCKNYHFKPHFHLLKKISGVKIRKTFYSDETVSRVRFDRKSPKNETNRKKAGEEVRLKLILVVFDASCSDGISWVRPILIIGYISISYSREHRRGRLVLRSSRWVESGRFLKDLKAETESLLWKPESCVHTMDPGLVGEEKCVARNNPARNFFEFFEARESWWEKILKFSSPGPVLSRQSVLILPKMYKFLAMARKMSI